MKTTSLPDSAALLRAGDAPGLVFAAVRKIRGRHLVVIDAFALTLGVLLALEIAGAPMDRVDVGLFLAAAIPIVVRMAVNLASGLYQRVWGHASVPDFLQVLQATFLGSAVGLATVWLTSLIAGPGFARLLTPTFWFLELVLAVAAIGISRFALRALTELAARRGSAELLARTPALLFGAGREGAVLARSALSERRAKVLPVGFLDSDETRWGNTIAGLKVFGDLTSLDKAIRETGARMLLITATNAPGTFVRTIMTAAQAAGLEVRRVPAVHELLDGGLDASRIRSIRVEDLLTREQVTTHAPGVEMIIRDKAVMVTGAGGSIGSELARQIVALRPSKLILVDRAESPLYMIERELNLRNIPSSTELSVHIANVVSRRAIRKLIESTRPSVIFHAAAYKHVPMMEEHPSDGVYVNVGGTDAVLEAAAAAGVERFVLVSTDKAVEPTSVMGATKRIAEWLVADAAKRTGRPYVAVRFGNVLGSAGSVLPIFERQLERGEALTVTHPSMTRYFMTIQEAGWLILDAAAIGGPGDLFVLDMGDPVSILEMAKDLVRLTGRDPLDVEIVFTGLRPGEKLTEKLYYDAETVGETDVPKISRVLDPQPPRDVRTAARNLLALADGDHDEELRASLFATLTMDGRFEQAAGPDAAQLALAYADTPSAPQVNERAIGADVAVLANGTSASIAEPPSLQAFRPLRLADEVEWRAAPISDDGDIEDEPAGEPAVAPTTAA